MYKVGDPDDTGAANGHSDLWYERLCGAASGVLTLSAPTAPGRYKFRYLVGDVGAVARSSAVNSCLACVSRRPSDANRKPATSN